jgi:hypothetical protein
MAANQNRVNADFTNIVPVGTKLAKLTPSLQEGWLVAA